MLNKGIVVVTCECIFFIIKTHTLMLAVVLNNLKSCRRPLAKDVQIIWPFALFTTTCDFMVCLFFLLSYRKRIISKDTTPKKCYITRHFRLYESLKVEVFIGV